MSAPTARQPTDREQAYAAIQMACAGYHSLAVLQALCDSVAMVVGFMAADQEQAELTIAELPADLIKTMRNNWTYLRELRAATPLFNAVGHS